MSRLLLLGCRRCFKCGCGVLFSPGIIISPPRSDFKWQVRVWVCVAKYETLPIRINHGAISHQSLRPEIMLGASGSGAYGVDTQRYLLPSGCWDWLQQAPYWAPVGGLIEGLQMDGPIILFCRSKHLSQMIFTIIYLPICLRTFIVSVCYNVCMKLDNQNLKYSFNISESGRAIKSQTLFHYGDHGSAQCIWG